MQPRRVAIHEAVDGKPVRIAGHLRFADSTIMAPLSGRRCAGYRASIEGGDGRAVIERALVPFRLADDTGAALIVAPPDALLLASDKSWGWQVPNWEGLQALLERQAHPVSSVVRSHEAALVEGLALMVTGIGRWEPDPHAGEASGYRDVGKRLVMRPQPGYPLTITADRR